MKKNRGIAILLMAILLRLCGTGTEIGLIAFFMGLVGLSITIYDDRKTE